MKRILYVPLHNTFLILLQRLEPFGYLIMSDTQTSIGQNQVHNPIQAKTLGPSLIIGPFHATQAAAHNLKGIGQTLIF
jgi:hypothetical protein